MNGTFKVSQSKKNGQFWFVLIAANHEIIGTSEMYKYLRGVLTGIEAVKRVARKIDNYHILKSVKDEPYFVLKADNGEIILTSEMYSSPQACITGIQAVMKCVDWTFVEMENHIKKAITHSKLKDGDFCVGCGNPSIEKRDGKKAWCSECIEKGKPAQLDNPGAEPARAETLPGRNDICNCGSDLKFKKCCMNKATK